MVSYYYINNNFYISQNINKDLKKFIINYFYKLINNNKN